MNAECSFSSLFLTGLIIAQPIAATAGFSVNRIAETRLAAPISVFREVDFSTARASYDDVAQAVPGVMLSAETRARVRGVPAFSGLSDTGVDSQYAAYNLLTLRSIATIATEHDDLANTLGGLYLNNRISLSLAKKYYTDIDLRHDGSARVGDEAININWLPARLDGGASGYGIYTPDGFRFMNSLAREGYHALQDGYSGPPPETEDQKATYSWNLFNQNVETGLMEVDRLRTTMDVLDGILADGMLPDGIGGIPRAVGFELRRDPTLTDEEEREAAGVLKGYIGGMLLPVAESNLEYEELGKLATAMFLDDKFPSISSAAELTKLTSNWTYCWRQTTGPYGYVSIGGGGGFIDQTDPVNPVLNGYNHFWQAGGGLDGTVVKEEIEVPEVDYISGGYYTSGRLFIGGWSVGDGLTKFYGYRDTDDDGFVEEGTREFVFSTDMFSHGVQILPNEGRNELVGFDLGTRNLYRFDMMNGNGFPTMLSHQGGLGSDRSEIHKVAFNEEGDWAMGLTLGYRYAWQPFNFALEARYSDTAEAFEPVRTSYRYEEVGQLPALAETPVPGSTVIRATYTPNIEFGGYKWENDTWNLRGSVQADPYGRAILEMDEPFQIGARYRFGSEELDEWSPVYRVPDLDGGPVLGNPKLYKDDFKFDYFYRPGEDLAIDRRATLNDAWELGAARTILAFGFGNARLLEAALTVSGYYRARIVPKGPVVQPEYFLVAPTAIFTFFPGWNDYFGVGGQFALSRPQDLSNPYLTTPGMGSLTSILHMISNPFATVSLEYKLQMEQYAAALNYIYVIPDLKRASHPPVERNEFGDEVVYFNCLVMNDFYYPVFQFLIRPPDNCLFFHWHSPFFPRVYHLEADSIGRTDPFPAFCGYGTVFELPLERIEVPFGLWKDFIATVTGTGTGTGLPYGL